MNNTSPENMSVEIDHDKQRVTFVHRGLLNKEFVLQSYGMVYAAEGFDPICGRFSMQSRS